MWRGPPPPEISQNLGFNPNVGGLWKRRRDTPKNQMNQIKKILSKGINSFEQKKENINKVESLVEQGLIKKEILEEMQEYIVIKESMQKLANNSLYYTDHTISAYLASSGVVERLMEKLMELVREVDNKLKDMKSYFEKREEKFTPVKLKNYEVAKRLIRGGVLQTYSDNPLLHRTKRWGEIMGGAKKKKSPKNKSVKKVKSSKQKRSRKKQK